MPVPEAPVDEDSRAPRTKNHVRLTWNISTVQAIAKAASMQAFPQNDFGLCVLPPDPRHHPAAGGSVDDVRHWLAFSGAVLRPQEHTATSAAPPLSLRARQRHFRIVCTPACRTPGFSTWHR